MTRNPAVTTEHSGTRHGKNTDSRGSRNLCIRLFSKIAEAVVHLGLKAFQVLHLKVLVFVAWWHIEFKYHVFNTCHPTTIWKSILVGLQYSINWCISKRCKNKTKQKTKCNILTYTETKQQTTKETPGKQLKKQYLLQCSSLAEALQQEFCLDLMIILSEKQRKEKKTLNLWKMEREDYIYITNTVHIVKGKSVSFVFTWFLFPESCRHARLLCYFRHLSHHHLRPSEIPYNWSTESKLDRKRSLAKEPFQPSWFLSQ